MCGIIGISNHQDPAFNQLYNGLLMLQHRGQDSAGIVTYDGNAFYERKAKGLVKDVFREKDIEDLKGCAGIGQIRYPTAGNNNVSEAQPFFVNAPFGIYLVHNGNLTNTESLRINVTQKYQRHLQTQSDSEILLNILADKIYQMLKKHKNKKNEEIVMEAIKLTMQEIKGGYSVIAMIDKVGLIAFRDPHGIRPLSLGKRSTNLRNEWILGSEDVAFSISGFNKVRDIDPGEAVLIKLNGDIETKQCVKGALNPCIFEYVYLARPDSMLDNISVYKTQLRMGQMLAKQITASKLKIDSIVPVPDSSRPVALEISKITGIKYREGLVKNRYVGRTFIMPEQSIRRDSIRRKLNIIPLEFRNRNILLVDDSIVRGNTMREIVNLCKQAGAKKIYVASAAPPVKYPNVYGIDMPTKKEFIAHNLENHEIEKALGIDKIFYQTLPDLIKAVSQGNPKIKKFDCSCFDGKYVTGDIDKAYLEKLEKQTRHIEPSSHLPLINL